MQYLVRRMGGARKRHRGQALVEFSLVLIPFVLIIMGIFDLGRGIYMMNGTAEAAREIARVTSVHSGCLPDSPVTCDLGASTETANAVATQRRMVPGMAVDTNVDIVCVDINDLVISPDKSCKWGEDYVRVRVRSTFTPITPVVSMFGSHTFESYSRVRYYP